jgi:hypothetical protein
MGRRWSCCGEQQLISKGGRLEAGEHVRAWRADTSEGVPLPLSWWRKLKDDDGDGDEVAVCSYSVSTSLLKVLGSS